MQLGRAASAVAHAGPDHRQAGFLKRDPFVSPKLTGLVTSVPRLTRAEVIENGRSTVGSVDNRQAIGSWLSGPRAAAEDMGVDFGYRGQRLGLPKDGPGSVAPLGRRFAAIFIDWALCALIAYQLIARGDQHSAGNWALLVFFVLGVLTVGTVGFTPGKRLLGLRVVAEEGGRLGIVRVVVRTLLLCLAIPALIWDRDGRGLHDRLARAVQVRI